MPEVFGDAQPVWSWDLVTSNQVDDSNAELVVVRGAHVRNIDVTAPYLSLLKMLEAVGMPARGDAYDEDYADLLCVRRRVYGVNSLTKSCRVEVTYQQSRGLIFFPTAAWRVVDDASVTTEVTQLDLNGDVLEVIGLQGVTGGLHPMLVGFDKDVIDAERWTTLRTVTLQREYPASNTAALAAARAIHKKVNASTFMGLPAGYWVCPGRRIEVSSRDPSWRQVSVTIVTREERDWKGFHIFRDRHTGMVPKNVNRATVATKVAAAYTSAPVQDQQNGFTVWKPFATTNYDAVFDSLEA